VKFSKSHEYVKVEGNVGTVGISQFAADQLGDVAYVELPAVGKAYTREEEFGVVESVKAASDIYAPIAGEVVAKNEDAIAAPESVNQDCYAAWLFKLKPANPADVATLLDAVAYAKVEAES